MFVIFLFTKNLINTFIKKLVIKACGTAGGSSSKVTVSSALKSLTNLTNYYYICEDYFFSSNYLIKKKLVFLQFLKSNL